ncbi:MAG: deoxyribonuclease V [Dehalococcoidia bacterium]
MLRFIEATNLLPKNRVIIIIHVIIRQLHDWNPNIGEAKQIQLELARQVSRKNEGNKHFNTVAGVDISGAGPDNTAIAAIVVLSFPDNKISDIVRTKEKITFPYISGFLSFREIPVLISAFKSLTHEPDIIMVDGQGIAHPRRFGLASHLGVLLDIPTIGCAKSRLCGHHETPENVTGAYTELIDNDEVIGAVVKTKTNVKPVYVSIGHKIDLQSSIKYVVQCCSGYRLPEPTRLAHLAASGKPADTLNN